MPNNPPNIRIKAINPGYTVDGQSNTNEFIELEKLDESPISLADLLIIYTNTSGNNISLYAFPADSSMVGPNLLLRLASSSSSELADATYSTQLALKAGPLQLVYKDQVIDSICWNNEEGCNAAFNSKSPTTLVRNTETGTFEHQTDYIPAFDPLNPSLKVEPDETPIVSQCKGLEFSEVLSYYESYQSEQFIEFYNPTSEQILLDGCSIRYKNKSYSLSGITMAEGYFVRYLTDFALTKNPTSENQLELIDTDGTIVDQLIIYNGQKKATSIAHFGYNQEGKEQWLQTYLPTPGEANNYQKYRTCTDNKVINEETGNCVKATIIEDPVKICPAGKYLNPLTGRCKSYENTTTKTCPAGYELNPTTNRCKKIVSNTGADYPLVPNTYEEQNSFIAIGALIIVITIGIIYIVYQYHHEIANLFKRNKP